MLDNNTRWTTRTETNADIAAVRAVNLAAFDTEEEADLVDSLRRDRAWIDELSVVSVDEAGKVVGYALLTRCHIGDTPALCLAPCAVLPDNQNTGAGSAATRAALTAARNAGEQYVTVLGHPTYYPRFGFERASKHGVHMNIDVPGEALMVLALGDRPVPAGAISYAAAFGEI
ncbi:GNAT family N-acetyltransferase [Rhodococcoides fascians]|uniref:GNAT family N-acetyltransferase n=1 Tax=Rhodococcoides fascians TaxID=1828 RepID=UPI00056180DD|nr:MULTISPECIES: N-acetyltransferase [Rhodococcus]OZC88073.1 N-acetyltransferase [Rhodococcus sp. 06-418-1B]